MISAGVTGAVNPVKGTRIAVKGAKSDAGLDAPRIDTSPQDQILQQQKLMQAELDAEENRRRKRLLSAAQGIRAFRGSPLFRASPSNSVGRVAGAAAVVGGTGTGGSSGSTYTGATGGYYGSGARGRTLIP